MPKEKIDYSLPVDYPMFDMCYCMANGCKTPCARKRAPHGYCTVSDFASSCSKYQTESDDPAWDELVKEVKEKINQENSK